MMPQGIVHCTDALQRHGGCMFIRRQVKIVSSGPTTLNVEPQGAVREGESNETTREGTHMADAYTKRLDAMVMAILQGPMGARPVDDVVQIAEDYIGEIDKRARLLVEWEIAIEMDEAIKSAAEMAACVAADHAKALDMHASFELKRRESEIAAQLLREEADRQLREEQARSRKANEDRAARKEARRLALERGNK